MFNAAWIYDLEMFKNYFCIGLYNINTKKKTRYEIYKLEDGSEVNQLPEIIEFLLYCKKVNGWMIGFNNISYDYPMLHNLIFNTIEYRSEALDNWIKLPIETVLYFLYWKSQELVEAKFNINDNKTSIPEWKIYIQQIDLFKLWHYNNKAKMISLKGLEIAMRMNNVEDTPYNFDQNIDMKAIEQVRLYNDNDLYATYEKYLITIGETENPIYKGQNKLALRKELSATYGLNLMNSNDVAIGKSIVIKKLSETLQIDMKDLKELRTWRTKVDLKDCVPDFISYGTPQMNTILDYYKTNTITNKDIEDVKV